MLTRRPAVEPPEALTPTVTLNQGWSGVTQLVWETSVSGGVFAVARATASGAPPEAAGAVPRMTATTAASEQRAVLPQRIDTGRG
jgi:hypothetical protein